MSVLKEPQYKYKPLALVLLLIAAFSTVDYFTTQSLVVYGEYGEGNPFMRVVLGTPYFALYKLGLIPLGLLFLWLMRRIVVPKYLHLVGLVCGVYALLMVYTWLVFYA